jgi:hypothetical protein
MNLYNSTEDLKNIVDAIKNEMHRPLKDKISKQDFDKVFDTKCGTAMIKQILDKIEDTLRVKNI